MITMTEQTLLHEQVQLGDALARLQALPDYQKVYQYLFGTKPNDLLKTLGLTELGSAEHKQLVREMDALSLVSHMLNQVTDNALNAKDELNQLSTKEDE